MNTLEIYDCPLCCSTGVCSPSVDPALAHFAADLDWLRGQGVVVHRYNLAFEPAAFTRYDDVKEALRIGQMSCLPLLRMDGRIVSQGRYPNREQLASWLNIMEPQTRQENTKSSCGCSPSCCS